MKLVFLNGKLQRSPDQYKWVQDRLLFKNVLHKDDHVTVLYFQGERTDYNKDLRSLYEIIDPLQEVIE